MREKRPALLISTESSLFTLTHSSQSVEFRHCGESLLHAAVNFIREKRQKLYKSIVGAGHQRLAS